MPVFGTCAGMILLATEVLDGRPDQRCFGADRHRRAPQRLRAPGRQLRDRLDVSTVGGRPPFHGVFIRAPKVERVGRGVDVLADTRASRSCCVRDTLALRRSILSWPATHACITVHRHRERITESN